MNDCTHYGAALRELDAIAAKARESDQKYADLRRALAGRCDEAVTAQLFKHDELFARRHHMLAKLRYAFNYRWALRKIGVKPEEVTAAFTRKVDRPGRMTQIILSEVETHSRRLRVEPFEILRELIHW